MTTEQEAGLAETAKMLGEAEELLQKQLLDYQQRIDFEILKGAAERAQEIQRRTTAGSHARYYAKSLETVCGQLLLALVPDQSKGEAE